MIDFTKKRSIKKEISQKYIDLYFNDLEAKGIDTTEEGYHYFYDLIPRICEQLSYGDLDFDKVDLHIHTRPMRNGNVEFIHLSRVVDVADNAEMFIDYLCNMIFDSESTSVDPVEFFKLKTRVTSLEREIRAIKMSLMR